MPLHTKRKLLITLTTSATATATTHMAHAQNVPVQKESKVDGEATMPTITGSGPTPDGYRRNTESIAICGDASLLDMPLSISVITRARLDDQRSHLLSEVVRNDTSVVDN